MKRIALLILIALAPIVAFSQQGYKLDLNHLGTITFPDTPKLVNTAASKVYTFAGDSSLYIATAAPINKFLGAFGSVLDDSFYTGVIKGTLKESRGKLFYRKNIKLEDHDGVEFGYKASIDSVTYYCYHQAFNIKSTLIFYGYWSRDSLQSNDKNMRAFFGSLKFSKAAVADSNMAFKTGQVLGIMLVVFVVLAAGVGLIFLIRRMTKA